MPEHPIADAWKSAFGSVLPAGFLCRRDLPERWLRIHSLAQARRYPESAEDRVELLRRHNAAADYVLGDQAPCMLFFARFGDDARFVADELPLHGRVPEHILSCRDDASGDNYQFLASHVTWTQAAFDDLIAASAEDQTGPILFTNLATRSIYAPYDGGADLFLPTAQDVAAARAQFASWLSTRTDGL